MSDSIQLTSEEIQQYREQFKDYPDALKTLDIIDECDGYLDSSLTLILMRETGKVPDKNISLNELVEKCRPLICKDEREDVIELFNVIASFLPPPASQAMAVVLYVTKVGIKRFCKAEDTTESD